MEHFTFGRNNGLRVSALALGTGTFGSRWGYGADPDEQYRHLDEVSRIYPGQPHNEIAARASVTLGGDKSGITPPRAARA